MTSTHSSAGPARDIRVGDPPGARTTAWRWGLRPAVWAPALLIAVAGFQRRWMSDDGHIYVRTVRQVLAGNGPVFNPGERAESSTGTLWQWLLVLGGATGADVASVAVYGGLLLTVAGFVLAGIGALRARGAGGLDGPGGPGDGARFLVPCGAVVLLALPPVWDFATSGLETGLATCWIAAAWLALVARPHAPATCALIGLGPLVRPDLGLVSVVFLAAQWVTVRPSWRGALAGAGVAGALPAAYEIFRMGYYGHLVPLPGVTKEASRSLWGRGATYLWDFAGPYGLWLPLAAVGAGAVVAGRARLRAPVAAPCVAGVLCWVYVVRVGGDFMHARMFLPGLLLMLLPVFLVPLTRAWGAVAVVVCGWAVVCAGALRVPYGGQVGPDGVADERGVYVRQNADPHPVHHDFSHSPGNSRYRHLVQAAVRSGRPTLLVGPVPVAATAPSVTGVHNTLGLNGTVVPLDGAALDAIGLSYPLAAHSGATRGRVGHDKHLPREWVVAERGTARGAAAQGLDPARVEAARRALRCGPLAELRAATRAPLTAGRFWHNLTGAAARTAFRFPTDPVRAERELCGRPTP
ncbi:hypothetical protein [Streptomyces sp. NPDC002564]|uniref:hypothetical protein n=1 Tax=Streptomyces sp. NPDC002564 TaxID=3364649 RepID=UPI003678646B